MAYLDLFRPPYLKELCAAAGFAPTKQFGQNYLISDRPIREMLAAAEVGVTDTVVEIGPGFGVLTLALAQTAQQVVAFEIEQQLRPYWDEQQTEYTNVRLVWGNALQQLPGAVKNLPPYKIVANLPYQITARAIRTFFELDPLPASVTIMVQREVADRLTAPPGEKSRFATVSDGSILTVLVHYFGTPEFVTPVTRGSFWPSPNVDSAVVSIKNIRPRPEADSFMQLVHAAFAHKRKKMLNNIATQLKTPTTTLQEACKQAEISPDARAESLTMSEWERFHQTLQKLSTASE